MASAYNNIGQDELNNKFNFDAAFKVRARLGGRRGRSRIRTHLRPWRSRRLILCVRCDAGVSRGGQLGSGAIDVQLQPRARAAQDRARTQPATASSRLLAQHKIGRVRNLQLHPRACSRRTRSARTPTRRRQAISAKSMHACSTAAQYVLWSPSAPFGLRTLLALAAFAPSGPQPPWPGLTLLGSPLRLILRRE
jgi:hypothetical protein